CQAAGSMRLRAAHGALATALAEEPDRSVWHRAAAAVRRDEQIANDLEATATHAARRGALAEAVAALERTVALTRDSTERGRRLLQAVEWAADLGHHELVLRLLRQLETLELGPQERTWLLWFQESFTDEVAWSGVEL